MKASKTFDASPAVRVSTHPTTAQEAEPTGLASLVISLPENSSNVRNLYLTEWVGRGIDDWVWACASQLRVFLAGKSVTISTVVSYWRNGMSHFFEYVQAHGPCQPDQLQPIHLRSFIDWLSQQGWAYGTQKTHYKATKSVLSAMIQRRVIPVAEGLFPANPYPGSNGRMKGQAPLSFGERDRLARALRDDIISLHRGRREVEGCFQGTTAQALVVYLLGIAIRCGANATPLLEVERDCVLPHPFLPSMRLLILFKRRGNATNIYQLRWSRQDDAATSIGMDGVALLTMALKLTQPWVSQATPAHRDRLWLYPSEGGPTSGKITVLTSRSLYTGIQSLIERHGVLGDDGKPLKLNLQRLRKTVAMRLFDLSGGDLIATAALMNHAPPVDDINYLSCTQPMREDATFVGEILPDLHRSGEAGFKPVPITPLSVKTPSGLCKDSVGGDKAPKNGEDCSDFLKCFECRSYAITGHPDDLHRLFQTYFFIELEAENATSDEWRAQFRNTMNLIDRFATDKFGAEVVAQAKARAKAQPSKFWSSYSLSRGLAHA